MKILLISNLYPNSKEPARGIYNKQQVVELTRLCEVRVVAPLPWHQIKGVPSSEVIDGIQIYHPRYFMTPKIGRSLYGFFFYFSLLSYVKKLHKEFGFDVILATWAYPDGFGSYLIAKALKKPIVIKVHGTDINEYSKYFLRRKLISHALKNSNAVIAVTGALKKKLSLIGVPEEKITVIPNGVNTDLFKPIDQAECRKKLDLPLDKKIILYVGNFVPIKGVDILVKAFSELVRSYSNALLLLVGDGSLEAKLHDNVKELGIEQGVIFSRRTTHDSIPFHMNACDIFCLPSRNEGCPNVVLEAMACGTPIVATNVGGVPELVNDSRLGMLVIPGSARFLTDALKEALDRRWNHDAIALHGSKFTWTENAQKLFQMLLVISKSSAR